MITPWSLPRTNGIARFAKEHRWNLMTADRLEKFERPESFDGILMTVRDTPEDVATAQRIIDSGTPVVDLTEERADLPMWRVASDNITIGQIAARHFVERGFTSFAWFSSDWTHVHEQRFAGYTGALPQGAKVARWSALGIDETLKTAPQPIAVLTYGDIDAARLVNACRQAGRDVPGEIAILGVGNDPFLCENQATPISSIEQNLAENAYEGAALLERLMNMTAGERRAASPVTTRIAPGEIVARESSNTLANSDPQIRAALVSIHKNLSRSFGAREIAADIGMKRRALDRLFADVLHRSVGEEVLRQRMIRAKRLLKLHEMPVKQIAMVCGFCSPAHLTNVFRRQTGLSPVEWRKKNS